MRPLAGIQLAGFVVIVVGNLGAQVLHPTLAFENGDINADHARDLSDAYIGGRVAPAAGPDIAASYGRLPLSFAENRGQAPADVDFVARGRGYALSLSAGEAALALGGSSPPGVLRMRLEGGDVESRAAGEDPLPGRANYLIGSDPSRWRAGIPTWSRVRYAGVLPGVDLVYYGNQGRLEYDLELAPGADPAAIRLSFEGADAVELTTDGDLVLCFSGESVRFLRPVAYQGDASALEPVEARFVLDGCEAVRFEVGAYDRDAPLVIDPVVVYSTYLGGNGTDRGIGIVLDSADNAYVAGNAGVNFPTTAGAHKTVFSGGSGSDCFVLKLNAAGSALVYSTYVGGTANEGVGRHAIVGSPGGTPLAVDAAGNAVVCGVTFSADFPTVRPYQASRNGTQDAFVFKLDAAGSSLVYSTFLGGGGTEYAASLALDAAGDACVTGEVRSADFPLQSPLDGTLGGAQDAFVTKVHDPGGPASIALVYSTYLGGISGDHGLAIAVDSSGNAYVGGQTSGNFPVTPGTFQTVFGGGNFDAFVVKINSSGSGVVYASYLGGNQGDTIICLAVDAAGNAYSTGQTASTTFPTTTPIQAAHGGGTDDVFVTKVNASGTAKVYSTYLGGNNNDHGFGIAVHPDGSVYLTGRTNSTNFPLAGNFQAGLAGNQDAFVTKISPAGTSLVYSSHLGGTGNDQGSGVAVASCGDVFVTGDTGSANLPTVNPLDGVFGGGTDVFVAKIADGIALVADAGPDQTVDEGDLVTLNGTGSCDPLGNVVSYLWTQVSGPPVTLSSPTAATPTFTAPEVPVGGDIVVFQLVVSVGPRTSTPDFVSVVVNNLNDPPTADAGADQSVSEGDAVALDGSNSSDPDGDALTYSWTQIAGPIVTLDVTDPAHPTFTVPVVGPAGATLTFELVVHDGLVASAADTVSINVVNINQPPVADAGADQLVDEGSLVTLDGLGSNDPDGDALTYTWTQTSGPAVVLSLADPAHPTFTAPQVSFGNAVIAFELVVSDGTLSSAADTVAVTVLNVNHPPIASAGADQTGDEGEAVTLDGSGSSDPDGDPISYHWTQASGPAVALNLTDPVHPTFTAPQVGPAGAVLTFELVVEDPELPSEPDAVSVTVANVNLPPVASTGPDLTVNEGDAVAIDGTGSGDPDGDPITFEWTQVAGPPAALDLTDPARPTFTAPLVPAGGATLTFQLVVSDGELVSEPSLVNVTVKNVNHPPVADAGPDAAVAEASPVTLDGSASYDPDGESLTYAWVQVSGPAVALAGALTSSPSFTAPLVGPAGETIVFALTVSDGTDASTDTVAVLVENVNHHPVADAGEDQTVDEGSSVVLNGFGSSDPDGDLLTYFWVQVSGPAVSLSDPSSPTPTFTAPLADPGGDVLVFALVVDDGCVDSEPDVVSITVSDTNDPPACGAARASRTSLWPPNHKLVEVAIVGLTDPNGDPVTVSAITITQDEPLNGTGDGDTSPDAAIQGGKILLRAERKGNGNGRVYRISFTATDALGASCTGSVEVCVPHDQKPGTTCVDDGQLYNSFGP